MAHEPPIDKLDTAVRSGTRAVFIAQIASQLVTIGVLAVLYRFIAKSDYGLLGMAFPLVMLPRMLATLGLSAATIQRENLKDTQISALFWLNILLGVCACILTIGLGYSLAMAYGAPDLKLVCLALSGTALVAVLGAQHQALMERQLRIRQLAMLRIGAQMAGALTAVVLAVAGCGIWALVVQQYIELLVITVGVWRLESWRPSKLPRAEDIKSLVVFGGYYSLSTLMFFIAQNIDKILLSFVLGATKTGQQFIGMYSQAYQLMMKPVYIVTTPITNIMLPGLSRAVTNRGLFLDFVSRFYRMVAIMLLPCGVGLWVVGGDLMTLLGGPDWSQAGLILVVLAPTILMQGFINISGSLLAATGRADRLLLGSVLTAILLSQASLGGYRLAQMASPTPLSITLGVGIAVSVATTVVLGVPYLFYCFASVGIRITTIAKELRPSFLAAFIMGTVVWALRLVLVSLHTPTIVVVAVTIAAGVAIYFAIARPEIRWLIRQVRSNE